MSKSWFTKNQWPALLRRGYGWPVRVESAVFTPDGTRIIANTTEGPLFLFRDGSVIGIVALAIHSPSPSRIRSAHGQQPRHCARRCSFTHTIALSWRLKLDFIGSVIPLIRSMRSSSSSSHRVIGIRFLGDTVWADRHIFAYIIAQSTHPRYCIVSGSKDGVIRVHDAGSNRLIITISLPTIGTRTRNSHHQIAGLARSPALTVVDVRLRVHCVESGRLLMESDEIFYDRLVFHQTVLVSLSREGRQRPVLVTVDGLGQQTGDRLDDNLGGLVFALSRIHEGRLPYCYFPVALEASIPICIWSAQDGKVVLGPIKRYVIHSVLP
ncbi:Vegetative incompatibility protein HET-E-1 [Rhizoctonia solani]|uniref:Vegetative incompatibility protein HET-E-1 n=1 Tax=Rhizoctonia solani TaxID=456999 RepID=A0A8H8SY69_9AGAM|nr:Vegetative incompatibility protein HET-E-1 [Rhizoctonia solani]QRW21282.1 Vegetative incompatibility protein HET-E-1 [Rhizoctonia solani]